MSDAASIFPDSKSIPNLYHLLSPTLSSTSLPAEIRSAYRKAALKAHPDKLSSTLSPEELSSAQIKFQQIGFAYDVLKDEKRKSNYDTTGKTEEVMSGKSEEEWKEYFKELWKGEVNADTLDEFKKSYQGSEEETSDLSAAYTSSQGDLEFILNNIMCSTHEDEDRFISLINSSISSGLLSSTSNWKKAIEDTKGKSKRAEKAGKEALEAEEYAKELGVHNKLYGTASSKVRNSKGKGKGKGKADGEDDVESLRALIQAKQVGRMDSIIGSIEAKYAKKEAEKESKKGKGKRKSEVETEPSEEEFLKMQAAVDARRESGGNGNKKRKST